MILVFRMGQNKDEIQENYCVLKFLIKQYHMSKSAVVLNISSAVFRLYRNYPFLRHNKLHDTNIAFLLHLIL